MGGSGPSEPALDETASGRRRPGPIAIGVLAFAIAALLVAAAVTRSADTARVPPLVGQQNLRSAQLAVEAADLRVGRVTLTQCSSVGTIAEQHPSPGAVVPAGSAVTISVCRR